MFVMIFVIIFFAVGLICLLSGIFDDGTASNLAEQEFRKIEDKNNYSTLDYAPYRTFVHNSFGCYWIGNYLRH